ncbi:hypothetical protein [Anaeromicropila herbilytica]|uniref:Uncharacterized protein n=1 Tax=Anaeromicropila herbilytica TaxID=2785025 RepID=A0A7R7EQK2_9FIRM|nr:hypothetical protein [Anaeromicropila herbilytica]BCN32930.1 hypothetical protein bsdtb5_42250 [Anaeromicropila herbilytica]
MINRKSKASYTVEATFVMIIVLSVIFALIYLTFYLSDKSRIQGILDLSVVKISEMMKADANIVTGEVNYDNILDRDWVGDLFAGKKRDADIGESYLKQQLKNGLILAEIKSTNVTVSNNEIEVNVVADMNIPLEDVREFFTKENQKVSLSSKGSIHNPAEFIRLSEVSLKTVNKIKGADEIIAKIKKVLDKLLVGK